MLLGCIEHYSMLTFCVMVCSEGEATLFVQPYQLLSVSSLWFSGGFSRINVAGTVQHCSVPLLFLKHSALRTLKRGTIPGDASQETLLFKEFM